MLMFALMFILIFIQILIFFLPLIHSFSTLYRVSPLLNSDFFSFLFLISLFLTFKLNLSTVLRNLLQLLTCSFSPYLIISYHIMSCLIVFHHVMSHHNITWHNITYCISHYHVTQSSSRTAVGRLVNAPDPERTIIFTSCGSESDNRAIDMAIHHYNTRTQTQTQVDRHTLTNTRACSHTYAHTTQEQR